MASPAYLTLQTHLGGLWHDAALVEVQDPDAGIASPTTLAYDTQYYFTFGNQAFCDGQPAIDCRALSVLRPLDLAGVRQGTWPPFLLDLLPQGAARRRLADELGLDADSKALDLPLLMRGAGAPIGNIRVKEAWTAEQERLAMGDTDNHGRNTALQKRPDGWIGLTPRFDFAPMVFDPSLIAPSTTWACLRGRPMNVGYGPVCQAIGEVTGQPEIAAAVRGALAQKADLFARLPEIARRYSVPDEVISHACRQRGPMPGSGKRNPH
jgi:hypothetical protein